MMARQVTPYTQSLTSSRRGSLLGALAKAFAYYRYVLGAPILPEVYPATSSGDPFTGLPPAMAADESTPRSNHLQRESQTLIQHGDAGADHIRLPVGTTRHDPRFGTRSSPRANDQMAHPAS